MPTKKKYSLKRPKSKREKPRSRKQRKGERNQRGKGFFDFLRRKPKPEDKYKVETEGPPSEISEKNKTTIAETMPKVSTSQNQKEKEQFHKTRTRGGASVEGTTAPSETLNPDAPSNTTVPEPKPDSKSNPKPNTNPTDKPTAKPEPAKKGLFSSLSSLTSWFGR